MSLRGGRTTAGWGMAGVALLGLTCVPVAQAQNVPAGADPGITALPGTTPPPGVTTVPVPSSPAIPQSTIGGQYATYPLVPTIPPTNAPPPPPPVTPVPQSSAPMSTQVVQSPVNPEQGRVIQGPPTPPGLGARRNVAGVDLIEAFNLGQKNDATYRAALAERDSNRLQASQTIAGYLPTASYSYNNIPTEQGARHVATVTQPVVSLGGLATLREKHPRHLYADATLEVRAQDLATRLLTAVTDVIKANEAITLNDARIDALKSQSDRAERLYKGGQGTITDARDIEVRYEQALANRPLMAGDQIAAIARLHSITGEDTSPDAFRLPKQFGPITLQPQDAYLSQQAQENPQIAASRATERINKLETQRVIGSMAPVLGVSGTWTQLAGQHTSYVGISLNAPISPGSFFQIGSAKAAARRSVEETRQVEDKAKTELQRLYALVGGGRDALIISAKAIEAAEFAVEANSKSYEGGVRTNVDVINAIQTVFEVKNNYVQSAVTLASNYLNLMLLAGDSPDDALAATQKFLLGR